MPDLSHEQDVLADICSQYIGAWTRGNEHDMALTTGMLMGQVARIYRLNPPGGLIDVESIFTVVGLQLLGIEPNAESVHEQLMQANERLPLETRLQILDRIGDLPPDDGPVRETPTHKAARWYGKPLRDDDPAE